MNSFESSREEPSDIAAIESMIASASEFVVPTEDLRPQTLDAAREQAHDANTQRQLGAFFVCAVLLVSTCLPVVGYLGDVQSQLRAPTASQLQEMALEHSSRKAVGPDWGLIEAFTQWRRSQAEYLGNPKTQ